MAAFALALTVIGADDVIWKLVHVFWWPKYGYNDIALHCIAWVRGYFISKRHVGGQCCRRTNMLTREWQPYWSICCGESYWPRFSSPGPVIYGPIRSQREGQLVIKDLVNQGHCQRDAVTQVQPRRAVRCTWTTAPSYVLHSAIMGCKFSWVENFVTCRWVTKIGTPRK